MDLTEDQNGKVYDPASGVFYRSADSIRGHPGFPQARETYVRDVLALYGDDPFHNKLLMVAARIVVFAVAICLDAGHREDDRSTWPTVGNLKKALAMFSLASPRRIDQILGRLVQIGYLESEPSPIDGRVRLLRPTDRMLDHDQDWLMAHYAPLARLFGEADYRLPLTRDRRFQQVQRGIATGIFMESAMVLLQNPGIMLFLSRESGILVLLEMAKQSVDEGSATIPLSLSSLGKRFAVSRSHLRQLLLDADAQGFLDLDRGRRRITLRPALFECLDRFIAEGMSNHDRTGAAALRALEQDAQREGLDQGARVRRAR